MLTPRQLLWLAKPRQKQRARISPKFSTFRIPWFTIITTWLMCTTTIITTFTITTTRSLMAKQTTLRVLTLPQISNLVRTTRLWLQMRVSCYAQGSSRSLQSLPGATCSTTMLQKRTSVAKWAARCLLHSIRSRVRHWGKPKSIQVGQSVWRCLQPISFMQGRQIDATSWRQITRPLRADAISSCLLQLSSCSRRRTYYPGLL